MDGYETKEQRARRLFCKDYESLQSMANAQLIRDEREYNVVKSNILIQKSRFNFTAQEQKIILYLISKIKPEDKDFSSIVRTMIDTYLADILKDL